MSSAFMHMYVRCFALSHATLRYHCSANSMSSNTRSFYFTKNHCWMAHFFKLLKWFSDFHPSSAQRSRYIRNGPSNSLALSTSHLMTILASLFIQICYCFFFQFYGLLKIFACLMALHTARDVRNKCPPTTGLEICSYWTLLPPTPAPGSFRNPIAFFIFAVSKQFYCYCKIMFLIATLLLLLLEWFVQWT